MLKLQNILKEYVTGDTKVTALKGVSITFRQSEFVSILGPSGCGKTTLLNIIGGLDRYTDGDLSINGVSTKQYTDHDWDTYRNHSVGFVFQSYNLIPHQSVLANVELALTLSGVSREERRARARAALEQVGLGDQLHKKPAQMSGGQMQRVAIARALVNDPEILLADEPTGALDSDTSVQIMELLKEVAKNRLVIMVTHNPDLADQYSSRIIRLLDGEVVDDTNPYTVTETSTEREPEPKRRGRKKGTSMSFFTALSLSFNNLLTKKTRTLLTSFAGSIGIIGIALILALSTGVNLYIAQVQEDTLSSYPITIEAETIDLSSLVMAFAGQQEESSRDPHPLDKVYGSSAMYDLVNSLNKLETQKNNLKNFKAWLEAERNGGEGATTALSTHLTAIQYVYNLNLNVLVKDTDGNVLTSDINGLMQKLMAEMATYMGTSTGNENASSGSNSILNGGSTGNSNNTSSGGISSLMNMGGQNANNVWQELIAGNNGELVHPLLKDQYDLVGDNSRWPTKADEVVLVVNSKNEISDFVLYALGLKTEEELMQSFRDVMAQKPISNEGDVWTYDKILDLTFKAVPTSEFYRPNPNGGYTDIRNSSILMDETDRINEIYDRGTELKVVGIIRPNPEASANMISGSICYTKALTEHMIQYVPDTNDGKSILQDQIDNPTKDVFTGLPFLTDTQTKLTDEQKVTKWTTFLSGTDAKKIQDAKVKAFKTWYTSQEPSKEEMDQYLNMMSKVLTKDAIIQTYAMQLASSENLTISEAVEKITAEINASGLSDDQLTNIALLAAKEDRIQQYKQGRRDELAKKQESEIAEMYDEQAASFKQAQLAAFYDNIYLPMHYATGSYDENMSKLGHVDMDSPKTIHIYASTFESKEAIGDIIENIYNPTQEEEDRIQYTDYIAILMSSITTIINAISYVLIAFVSISLVVSSIMIGIITYISVLERTKEIGILRAIGASKRDVSRVFNAETMIVGFTAGALGIIVTLLLCIPINLIIHALTDISTINATLPIGGAIFLVVLSMVLTLIAGLLPSRLAAKKDPVVALRSE